MKIFIIILITLTILTPALKAIDLNTSSLIKVDTPSKEIYDDGINRIQYKEFSILSLENNEILKVGKYLDSPATIEVPSGTYKFQYLDNNGNKKEEIVEINNSFQVIHLK
ncbi:MAG: hypothetical protein ACPL1A_02815 [Candidatus Kapaibacteriota bacterium]